MTENLLIFLLMVISFGLGFSFKNHLETFKKQETKKINKEASVEITEKDELMQRQWDLEVAAFNSYGDEKTTREINDELEKVRGKLRWTN